MANPNPHPNPNPNPTPTPNPNPTPTPNPDPNPKQAAARALGELVAKLADRVLPILIPILQTRLQTGDAAHRQVLARAPGGARTLAELPRT